MSSDDEIVEVPESLRSKKGYNETKKGRKTKPKRGDSYNVYDPSDIVTFIEAVEKREEIWNTRNDNWHRKEVKMAKFGEIEMDCNRFMSHNARAIGKVAKDLWSELEIDYAKHMNRIKRAKSGSGVDDVDSDFQFAPFMSFVSSAKKDRETKTSFCFGAKSHIVSELFDTPKRKLENLEKENAKSAKISRRDSLEVTMKEEMGKTREIFSRLLESPSATSSCQSERICRVFNDIASGKSFIERVEMESKVIAFMSSLRETRGGSAPPELTLNPHNSSSYMMDRDAPQFLQDQSEQLIFSSFNSY